MSNLSKLNFDYKLVVLDLDGTLLDNNKKIPLETVKIINDLCEKRGMNFMIATARAEAQAEFVANQGGQAFQGYIACNNGALVKNLKTGEYLIKDTIEPETIKELVNACKKLGLDIEFMTPLGEVFETATKEQRPVDQMYVNMKLPINFQENIEEYLLNLVENGVDIPLIAPCGTKEQLEEAYESLSKIPGIQISGMCDAERKTADGKDDVYYFDIMKQGATKARAIEAVAKELDIPIEEIVVFGDGGNDKEMMEYAGLGVAMQNAKEELFSFADTRTKYSNNEGGVGSWLKSYDHIVDGIMKEKAKLAKKREENGWDK